MSIAAPFRTSDPMPIQPHPHRHPRLLRSAHQHHQLSRRLSATHRAAVIDPVLYYDHRDGTSTQVGRTICSRGSRGLGIDWILETHAHADHLSARLTSRPAGARIGIGVHIREVQRIFQPGLQAARRSSRRPPVRSPVRRRRDYPGRRARRDRLLIPGHTPAYMTYQIGDAVIIGDTLFMPDFGTARAAFPGGNADRSTVRTKGC